jgi:hypothetical protein
MRKVLTLFIFWTFIVNAFSQTGIPKAQAMFIYNFSRLIEWPESYKTGPFVIGVLGASEAYNELESFTKGKTVGSQPISVKKYNNTEDITNCHILFIPFSKTKDITSILPKIQNKSTLLITERNGATEQGSAINFLIIGEKLKFEIKPSNATKYDIKLSSKLNEMAFKTY